jgi:drug/metabolite transporter (DMT)-like permease
MSPVLWLMLFASLVTYLVPGFALVWGWLVLGETITGRMLAGRAVTLAGTACVTGFFSCGDPEKL